MALHFKELDFQPTDLGDLILRRRRMSQLGDLDIYEVKLGESFLMSSLFHAAEEQLAHLGLAANPSPQLQVVVGGLGLGYTARAALRNSRVSSLIVVEYLAPVIKWHEQGLVPLGPELTGDPRCQLIQGDFFKLSKNVSLGFHPERSGERFDAILLDIDHTPTNVLHQTNTRFYTDEGLLELQSHLKPGGVFALWADGSEDANFTRHLAHIFDKAQGYTIEFDNPITQGVSKGAVYVAVKSSQL